MTNWEEWTVARLTKSSLRIHKSYQHPGDFGENTFDRSDIHCCMSFSQIVHWKCNILQKCVLICAHFTRKWMKFRIHKQNILLRMSSNKEIFWWLKSQQRLQAHPGTPPGRQFVSLIISWWIPRSTSENLSNPCRITLSSFWIFKANLVMRRDYIFRLLAYWCCKCLTWWDQVGSWK